MQLGFVPMIALLVYLLREFVVVSARVYAARLGIPLPTTILGRIKTNVLCYSIMILYLGNANFVEGAWGQFFHTLGFVGLMVGLLVSYLAALSYLATLVRNMPASSER